MNILFIIKVKIFTLINWSYLLYIKLDEANSVSFLNQIPNFVPNQRHNLSNSMGE